MTDSQRQQGNLYGTTQFGGDGGCLGGCGTVFKPGTSDTERVLHSFGDHPDDGAFLSQTCQKLIGKRLIGRKSAWRFSESGTIENLAHNSNTES